MSAPHFHLLLNHLPVSAILFGLFFIFLGLLLKNESFEKVGFILFLLAALTSIPTLLTGDPAEESLEKFSNISEQLIEAHEEASIPAFILSEALGALSLIGIFLKKRSYDFYRKFLYGLLLIALITLFLMGRAANLGGKIRHSEILNSPQSSNGFFYDNLGEFNIFSNLDSLFSSIS